MAALTIRVWRERLKTQDLIGDISEAAGARLARAGFIARGGQMIDASRALWRCRSDYAKCAIGLIHIGHSVVVEAFESLLARHNHWRP